MKNTKSILQTSMMIAVGIAIVSVLKNFGGQTILKLFSPMHFPVILAGFAIGPIGGLLCGILTPMLSHLLNGMPDIMTAIGMVFELGTYGLLCGLGMKVIKKPLSTPKIYMILICAMLVGRIVGGLVKGFILMPNEYNFDIWFKAYFIGTYPAIIVDLLLIPIIVKALDKAGLISK